MTLNELGLIVIGLLGVFGWYNYNQRKKAEVDAKLADVKGQDKQLEEQQLTLQDAIKEIDANIAKAKQEIEERKNNHDNLSLKERQELWKKRLK